MGIRSGGGLLISAIVLVAIVAAAVAKERTWTDTTGKFSVSAELVEVEDGKAVLRRADGKTITVPVDKLSDDDKAFLDAQAGTDATAKDDPANAVIVEIATKFYGDLRSQERAVARQSLTKDAEAIVAAGQSPLVGLPQPDEHKRAIMPGTVKIEGDVAEVPVAVRAGGHVHKTKLHLRKEGDEWRVFGLSATYPDGEKSINFEAAIKPSSGDPIQDLIGQEFPLVGITLQGRPLDMAQFSGKVVLVDFWATWCGPCRAEIPNIKENWDKYHDVGFDVIAISTDKDLKALAAFCAQEQPPWTVLVDKHPRNKASMGDKYGIRAYPTFILVGKDGKVAAVNCRGQALGKQLEKLLGKGAAK
jgi:thiol-disulfide isomerase/thioredoxin